MRPTRCGRRSAQRRGELGGEGPGPGPGLGHGAAGSGDGRGGDRGRGRVHAERCRGGRAALGWPTGPLGKVAARRPAGSGRYHGPHMCGIVGYVGPDQALPILLEGLRRLEYRGYDSAGVAVHGRRPQGGQAGREARRSWSRPCTGTGEVTATPAWATRDGPPTEPPRTCNAHPHLDCTGRIAVIHNGIIENYQALRDRLVKAGHELSLGDRYRGAWPTCVEERLPRGPRGSRPGHGPSSSPGPTPWWSPTSTSPT